MMSLRDKALADFRKALGPGCAWAGRLLAFLLLLALPNPVQAQLNYEINNAGVTITGYSGPGGAVPIPGTIDGLPVISIGDSAFNGCTTVTSVTIPDGVTNIGNYAFADCSALTKVTLPSSVTSLGDDAFDGCTSMASVTIPNGVTNIGDHTFADCSALTKVTLPSGVTSLGDDAFAGCSSLPNVTLPGSLTSIGDSVFADCYSLTGITIPNAVTNLGEAVFEDCISLTSISVDAQNSLYSSFGGVLFNKSRTILLEYPGGLSGGKYVIPNGVTSIADAAFADCNLFTVTFPNTVTNIADDAFGEVSGLNAVYFLGDAPAYSGSTFFESSSQPTVYYLPGTSGWGPMFGGCWAILWNPQVQSGTPTFGVGPNGFGFTITGTIDIPIVLQASANPASRYWTTLQTCTLTNGSIYFSDPAWTNFPARFYRITSQ
jgi:hypothetical protein